jgi:hypothetical protein
MVGWVAWLDDELTVIARREATMQSCIWGARLRLPASDALVSAAP